MSAARGLLLVNTGTGKGKSTAAFGMALRAIGQNLNVCVIQFIKGKWNTGELEAARRLGLEFMPMGKGFTWEAKILRKTKRSCAMHGRWLPPNPSIRGVGAPMDGLSALPWTARWCQVPYLASEKILSGTYGLIILDEINYVLGYGYLSVDEVICTLQSRPPHVQVVRTGRNAPDEIISIADCVTEMRDIKHPYRAGVPAQKGIDF